MRFFHTSDNNMQWNKVGRCGYVHSALDRMCLKLEVILVRLLTICEHLDSSTFFVDCFGEVRVAHLFSFLCFIFVVFVCWTDAVIITRQKGDNRYENCLIRKFWLWFSNFLSRTVHDEERLIQKYVMCTKLDIYVFICTATIILINCNSSLRPAARRCVTIYIHEAIKNIVIYY